MEKTPEGTLAAQPMDEEFIQVNVRVNDKIMNTIELAKDWLDGLVDEKLQQYIRMFGHKETDETYPDTVIKTVLNINPEQSVLYTEPNGKSHNTVQLVLFEDKDETILVEAPMTVVFGDGEMMEPEDFSCDTWLQYTLASNLEKFYEKKEERLKDFMDDTFDQITEAGSEDLSLADEAIIDEKIQLLVSLCEANETVRDIILSVAETTIATTKNYEQQRNTFLRYLEMRRKMFLDERKQAGNRS